MVFYIKLWNSSYVQEWSSGQQYSFENRFKTCHSRCKKSMKIFRYKIPKGTNSARFEHIWINTSSFYKVCSFKFQARLFWEELILYYRFSKYFHVKIHRTLLPGEHFSVSAKIGRYNEILNSLWYGVFAPISRFFCHLGTRHLR